MAYEELRKEWYSDDKDPEVWENRIIFMGKQPLFTEMEVLNALRPYSMGCCGPNAVIGMYEEILCSVRGERHIGGRGYAKNREQLIIRPLNYAGNREELEGGIYWRFGDIALVLYGVLWESDKDSVVVKVSRSMAESWNVPGELLLANALLNSYAKMPPRLHYNTDLHGGHAPLEGVFMPGEMGIPIVVNGEQEREGLIGYRLTTAREFYGAAAVFYPGVKEQLARLLGGDFFLGFASVHEAVVHPVRHKVLNDMKAAILHHNAVADEKKVLTNQVYRYSARRGELMEV